METDYSIECSSARYDLGVVWAAVCVVVYPVGIPCMYLYLLYEARHLIKGRSKSDINAIDERGLQEMETAALTLSSLRFLYQEYQPEVRARQKAECYGDCCYFLCAAALFLFLRCSSLYIVFTYVCCDSSGTLN